MKLLERGRRPARVVYQLINWHWCSQFHWNEPLDAISSSRLLRSLLQPLIIPLSLSVYPSLSSLLYRSLSLPISLLCILSFPVLAVSSGIYDTDRPFQPFSPFPSFSSPPLLLLFSFSLLPPLCLSLSSGALSIRAPIEFLRLKCGHTNLMALSNRDALDPV